MIPKKRLKLFRKLLEGKLNAVGVEDTILYRRNKQLKAYLVPDPENKGMAKVEQRPTFSAYNPQRAAIRTLLRSNERAVRAFLRADISALGEQLRQQIEAGEKEPVEQTVEAKE